MKFYDVTLPISPNIPVWPGHPAIKLELVRRIEDGARSNVSFLACSAHTGTHVDAPLHFITSGADVATLPLDVLIGPAVVADLSDADVITAERLERLGLRNVHRLLLKTRNSSLSRDVFHDDYVALTVDAAHWVVERGVCLIGVDYLSVEDFGSDGAVHRALLGAGLVILEGVDLSSVPAGDYQLYCLPLKLVGSDGAPVRAILVQE